MAGIKITATTPAAEHIMRTMVKNESKEVSWKDKLAFRMAYDRTIEESPYSMTIKFKSAILERGIGVIGMQNFFEDQLKNQGLIYGKDFSFEVLV